MMGAARELRTVFRVSELVAFRVRVRHAITSTSVSLSLSPHLTRLHSVATLDD
jgi:hypothetical protein